MEKGDSIYWLAINGASAAASSLPLDSSRRWTISPTPEWAVGYRTQKEQQQAHRFFLTAPPGALKEYIASLRERQKDGEVLVETYQSPEAPQEQTTWIQEESSSSKITTETQPEP